MFTRSNRLPAQTHDTHARRKGAHAQALVAKDEQGNATLHEQRAEEGEATLHDQGEATLHEQCADAGREEERPPSSAVEVRCWQRGCFGLFPSFLGLKVL